MSSSIATAPNNMTTSRPESADEVLAKRLNVEVEALVPLCGYDARSCAATSRALPPRLLERDASFEQRDWAAIDPAATRRSASSDTE